MERDPVLKAAREGREGVKRELFIHIGYPKTGSKFIQNEIFPRLEEANFVRSSRIRSEVSRLARQDEFSFNYETTRRNIEKHLLPGKNMISYEGFIGEFFRFKLINTKVIADRLAALFPEAKIIITIRNQYNLIESLYKQYVHVGGTKRFLDFVNFRKGRFEYAYHDLDFTINVEMFHYLNVIGYYEKLFGRENLLVIPYELLKNDPGQFVNRLTAGIGIKQVPAFGNKIYNQGYGSRQIAIARFMNRFLKSKFRETGLIPDTTFPITGKIDTGKLRLILQSNLSRRLLGQKPITDPLLKSEIKKRFAESNQVLNQRYQLTLETLCPGEYF